MNTGRKLPTRLTRMPRLTIHTRAGRPRSGVAEPRLVDARPVRRRGAHGTGSVRMWTAAASRSQWAIASAAVAPRAMT